MRRAVAVAALALVAIGLTGCEETETQRTREQERYMACVEAGGDWSDSGSVEKCTMSGREQ